MDSLTRSRRVGLKEREGASGAPDPDYQAALGQAEAAEASGVGTSAVPTNGTFPGEASPGTLEMGGGPGAPVLQASPFHSDHVKAEVELRRHRPTTLDEDGLRLGMEHDESALGDSVGDPLREPNYGSMAAGPGNVSSAPRVARVEPSAEGPVAQAEAGSPSRREGLMASGEKGLGVVSAPVEARFSQTRGDVGEAEPLQPEDDPRELIPVAEDRLERLETLLGQVIDENRHLKRRLEITERESRASSYHSGIAIEQSCSPATFGSRSEMNVQRMFPSDFPGQPTFGLYGSDLSGLSFVPGNPQSWVGARSEAPTSVFPPGFGPVGVSVGPEVQPVRPPPLPLPPVPVEVRGLTEGSQTMRQFTENARQTGRIAAEGSGFQTPRGRGDSGLLYDSQGYPLSPGGTVIRPPPLPTTGGSSVMKPCAGAPGAGSSVSCSGVPVEGNSRPEEPAKYISELPKLTPASLADSAVVCGNWLAQIRQIFQGLSSTADVWFGAVEQAASQGYNRWLVADPLGRLALDPASIVAVYDQVRFQRVESRAVSLLLASLPTHVKDDIVMNRWLSTSAILFRVLCLYQPGGSSERAHLLSQLVTPETCKNFPDAVRVLRKWQQSLHRAAEVGAALPDASLLLKGVDAATAALLQSNPMVAFRVNSFRHSVALDYNPTSTGVTQLVRLLQAECEAVALIETPASSDRRTKAAALTAAKEPPPVKPSAPVPPTPPPVSTPAVAAVGTMSGDNKGKGKGKGSEGAPSCHKFNDASGCRFGDACMFKHDRAKAKKEGRCLACGQKDHFRPDCTVVSQENRGVRSDSGSEGSPKGASKGEAKSKAKARAGAQAKGIVEDSGSRDALSGQSSSGSAATTPEALVAEATKLLKGVSIRAVRVSSDLDLAWLRSALTSASDPNYCLIDSGATNALRPAGAEELQTCQAIKVDLASGTTELRINGHGTLLHNGACQVILPASYLVDLGYTISWKKKGCRIKHSKKGILEVSVVRGCPLVSKEVGLKLLQDYEDRRAGVPALNSAEVRDLSDPLTVEAARGWLKERVKWRKGDRLTDVDQLVYLRAAFPSVPIQLLARACSPALGPMCTGTDWSELPWNRRFRRSISRAERGSVVFALEPFQYSWKGSGRVVQVPDSEKGLGCRLVFQVLMEWAQLGVFGGFVKGAKGRNLLDLSVLDIADEEMVRMLRFLLLFAVAEACRTAEQDLEESRAFEGAFAQGWASSAVGAPESGAKGTPGSGSGGEKAVPVTSQAFIAFEPVGMWQGSELMQGKGDGHGRGWLTEWNQVYGLEVAQFDQGCLGAPGLYATEIVTSSWYLYETLHAVRADEKTKPLLETLQVQSGDLRLDKVGWVGNLVRLVQKAWAMWKWEQCKQDEVLARKIILKKLTEEESYRLHVAHDHVPYRKGCPICIQSQGRQRAHWRSGFPGMHSLSVDVAGPFVSGQAWDVEASGRDRGKGYKYFLACSYAIPGEFAPEGKDEENYDEYEPSECGDLLPLEESHVVSTGTSAEKGADLESLEELFRLPEGEFGGDERVCAVTRRVKGKRPEQAEELLASPVKEAAESELPAVPKGHRTLFFGTPLRSKRGREILPQIQGVINRLEAAGFPVQRFHADRAKELRTSALVSWLKDHGIHATWTAGESPAANRAELAVQNLKGFVRKLLFLAKLDKLYWPLALVHASTRNWVNFCESVGVPQPPLLPFGLRVQARKRVQTGYRFQWEPRTIEGVYLGHAPNTPGGHLVLITPDEGPKVLLTNTVYPMRDPGGVAKKPKYRLVGKRSPTFAVRVVAAAEFTDQSNFPRARSSPGGESSWNFESDSESHLGLPAVREGSGLGCLPGECSDSQVGDSSPEELGPGIGVFCDVELDFEDAFDPGSKSEGDVSQLVPGLEFSQSGLKAIEAEASSWIKERTENGDFTADECSEVLERGFGQLPAARRPMLQGKGRAVLLGFYGVGGFRGISKATEVYTEVTRYVNKFLQRQCPGHLWTTVYVSQNTRMPIHRDLRNAKGSKVLVRAVGEFVGGGLWIEGDSGEGLVSKLLPGGARVFGSVYDIGAGPIVFSGDRWHASEEWQGRARWVLSAFVPREFKSIESGQQELLEDLGFPVSATLEGVTLGSEQSESAVCALRDSGEAVGPAGWCIGLPVPLVGEDTHHGWECSHRATATLCTLLVDELSEALVASEEVSELAGQLKDAERQREWLEQCLVEERKATEVVVLRALQADVSLHPEGVEEDQFLQTRTIGLAEARRELDKWKAPAQEEITSLEEINKAVDRVKASDVDKWANDGVTIVQLPGKAVLTRKSGTGRRRCRAVCCGNYLPTDKLGLTRDELYASGAEALSVKVALTYAAFRRNWKGVTIDVKSAFLYAPIRSDASEERIIVKPPGFMIELGLLSRDDRWWVRKALYGLPTSPRDWGRYRDGEFRKFRMIWEGASVCLEQTKSDDALWLARRLEGEQLGDVVGLLIVYVDDLAFLGPSGLCQAFVNSVQTNWKTSSPEWLGHLPVTFCGIELTLTDLGFRMTQKSYVQELLQRYGVTEGAATPISKWVEPEAPVAVTAAEVKEAQAVTGALLWLSTRTRPDLSYVVSRCGQQATKCPSLSIALGRQALAYLMTTLDMGIDVPFSVGSVFSDHGLLALPRNERVIELYSDASHSPGGERSMQAIFIVWRSVPLAWEAARQPFTTLSSAEAELVSMIHGVQLCEAVQPLIEELTEGDTTISLLGDNEAAIRAFQATPGGWRNRHLRMRASAARERVAANQLVVTHLPGEHQVADLGTKPLSRARLFQLLALVNIRRVEAVDGPTSCARMLSRLCLSGSHVESGLVEALAGLALLAALPRVQGQPADDQLDAGIGWLVWVLGGVLTGVSMCWGWWWFYGVAGFPRFEWFLGVAARDLDRFGDESGLEAQAESGAEFREGTSQDARVATAVEPALSSEALGGSTQGGDQGDGGDEFTEEEWRAAQLKFAQMERESGLTFVQRARLRKALARGDVIDPPVFKQRYGPPPSWYCEASGLEEAQDSGGAAGSADLQGGQIEQSSSGVPSDSRDQVEQSSSGVLLDSSDQVGQSSSGVPLDSSDQAKQRSGQVGQGSVGVQGSSTSEFRGSSTSEFRGSLGRPDQWDDQSADGVEPGLHVLPHSSGVGVSGPAVQYGGSASSTDPCPFLGPSEQIGGSSSSHGWEVHQDAWGACYEDLVEPVEDLAGFPLVGTWVRFHFLICLLSKEGERILWFLGDRSEAWGFLRATSVLFRHEVASALVEVLRRGPCGVAFSGPQWRIAVEDYVFSGSVGAVLGPVFPYVEWGPNIVTHFLWKIFDLEGRAVLAYVGSRVRDWNCLMSVARGFRASSLYAFIGWLRDTAGPPGIANPVGMDAADAYVQAELREASPQEREDDPSLDDRRPFRRVQVNQFQWPPLGQALEQLSSSSEGRESSTTRPSEAFSSGESSVRGTEASEVEAGSSGGFGPVYEAFEESMAVTYVDDRIVVELPGWSLAEVEDLVRRLESGDGVELQRFLSGGQARQGSEASVPVGHVRSPWRPQRMQMLLGLLVLWIFCSFLRVVVAVDVELLRASDRQCTEGPVVGEAQVAFYAQDVDIPEDEGGEPCDGSYLWEASKAVLLILTWEITRHLCFCCRRVSKTRSVGSQTDPGATISMPLGADVHCRGRILFCLWQAGFNIDVGPYPERIRSEFHGLVGDYLLRVEDGEISDWDSD